ncbi:hypothetical protein CGLAUT_11610 [Corynebacterium glaucum]|uniref:DUF1345 domain-containing protein n=1 Tax=Corynebacterium glaucum TaxID=187491 RepID=UPI0025B29FF9|nr:DUF1345 domain-containing protein [Corynebacterium glaucum]WJZ08777.1 hypothetical protein CGLAUT_11610 [Corynebacterium glaucum]
MAKPRMRSEIYRDYSSLGIAAMITTVALNWVIASDRLDFEAIGPLGFGLAYYLVFWVLYIGIYVWWTIRMLRACTIEELRAYARRESRVSEKRWVRWSGTKGAATITITAAIVALAMSIMVARIPWSRHDPIMLTLAALTAVLSWAHLVVAYATSYLELDLGGDERQFNFEHTDEPLFDDYLTLATTTSTMGSASPAVPITREGWNRFRANKIVAFAFNTLVIAVVVAMVTTGLME